MVNHKPSIDVILERLENIKEDMADLKKSVDLLQEDYIQRKSVIRFVIWAASIGSAVASFFVTHVLDKLK